MKTFNVQNLIVLIKKYRRVSVSDEIIFNYIFNRLNREETIVFSDLALSNKLLVSELIEDEFLELKNDIVSWHEDLAKFVSPENQ